MDGSLTRFAPEEVIKKMTRFTRLCFNNRIINNILRTSMITHYANIRLRGFKPSILYTKYTTITSANEIEVNYICHNENAQCIKIQKEYDYLSLMCPKEITLRQHHEIIWAEWEDVYVRSGIALPIPISIYTDHMGNNYLHMIAYACINRAAYACVDISDVNSFFKTVHIENPYLFCENMLGETPLNILLYEDDFSEIVEAILLRLDVEKRFEALSLQKWSDKWLFLNANTFITNIHVTVKHCQPIYGFFTLYISLAHDFPNIFSRLFAAGYKMKANHILFKNDTFTETVCNQLQLYPCWHNITFWISYLDNYNFEYIRPLIELRNNLIKRSILNIYFSKNIANYSQEY